jgi:hypothetical protein
MLKSLSLRARVGAGTLTVASILALAGHASANQVVFVEVNNAIVQILVIQNECHDGADASIPGLPPASQTDGHCSRASVFAPIDPATGIRWAGARGFGCCPSEHWTALGELSGPNPFAPPVAHGWVRNRLTVVNKLASIQVVHIHATWTPESPMCLYDNGVHGIASLTFALYDSRFSGPCWQRAITFDGSEVGSPSVTKNGTTWVAVGPQAVPDFGTFQGGFRMTDTSIDVDYPLSLQPLQTLDLDLTFTGTATLGPTSLGPPGTQYGIVTNSLPTPCFANCDGSTVQPILNANDFQCFLNKFAAGDSYANCDGSTIAPVLNANDFQCYMNAFAAGCS